MIRKYSVIKSSSENESSAPQAAVPAATRNPYGAKFAADAAAIERCRLLGIPLSESYGGVNVQRGEEEAEAEVLIEMEPIVRVFAGREG